MLRTLSLTLVVIMMVCATLVPASFAISIAQGSQVTFTSCDANTVDFGAIFEEGPSSRCLLDTTDGAALQSNKKWGGATLTEIPSGSGNSKTVKAQGETITFGLYFGTTANPDEYGVFVNNKFREPNESGQYVIVLGRDTSVSVNKKWTVKLPTSTGDYAVTGETTVVENGKSFSFTVTPLFDANTGKVLKVKDITTSESNKYVESTAGEDVSSAKIYTKGIDSNHEIIISAEVPVPKTYSISSNLSEIDAHFTTDFQYTEGLKEGSTYSFTVTPAKGYNPPSVTVDQGKISSDGNGNYTVVVANNNVKVTFANGGEIKPKVTLSSDVTGATVTIDGESSSETLKAGKEVTYGKNVPVIVVVNDGYRVDSVTYTADGITRVLEGVNGNYTIPNVTGNVTVTVAVSQVQVTVVYKLPNATIGTFSIPSSGINKEVVCTVSNGIENGKITLETPNEQTGFTFNGWTSSDVNIDEQNQFSVSGTQDRTITVTGTWSFDVMSLFKTKSYSSTMTNSGKSGSYTNSVDYKFELNEDAKTKYASQMIVRAGGIVYCALSDQDLSVVKGYVGTGTYSDQQVFSEPLKVRGYIATSSSAIGEGGVSVNYRIGSPSARAYAHPWIKVELGVQSFVIFAEDLVNS